jgi:mediator of RNA polymerase II transcription subunit 12
VGKMRDDARHVVKKTAKEISRLFSKKFSIDVLEGGRIKKHSRGEFNFEVGFAAILINSSLLN